VGVGEVALDAGLLFEPAAAGHFAALVVGYGGGFAVFNGRGSTDYTVGDLPNAQAHGALEAVEDGGEALGGGFGASVIELDWIDQNQGEGDEEGGSFDEVPTRERFILPLMRSPSQWLCLHVPRTMRSSTLRDVGR
jgi:hypothetical protein